MYPLQIVIMLAMKMCWVANYVGPSSEQLLYLFLNGKRSCLFTNLFCLLSDFECFQDTCISTCFIVVFLLFKKSILNEVFLLPLLPYARLSSIFNLFCSFYKSGHTNLLDSIICEQTFNLTCILKIQLFDSIWLYILWIKSGRI